MKWPETLTLIRHDSSVYNAQKLTKKAIPLYQQFLAVYNTNPNSDEARQLALEVNAQFSVNSSDSNTPLANNAGSQSEIMAQQLKKIIRLPDVIFVSPYLRTQETLNRMKIGWPELAEVKTYQEERITEQDHGLVSLYSDWRVFSVIYPEQRLLHQLQGEYRYRFPQGENIPDVRERLRSWINTVIRDYNQQNVLAITHHLAILSLRANLERLDEAEFLRLDNEEKPINAGVTIYRGRPEEGGDGHLLLDVYNSKLY